MPDEIDIVQLAADVMERRGYAVVRHDTRLAHRDSGLEIKPVLLESRPFNDLVRSSSMVATAHPRLVPSGVLEYQHTFGKTLSDAVRDGLDQWVQLDFTVLVDALRETPESCPAVLITVPQADGGERRRRAVLGPVRHTVERQERPRGDGEHPFCPCCFLMQNYETFRPLLESDSFYGIRLFAARNQDGSVNADCRVNGQHWEDGQRALLGYVDTWPQAGLEWRKQYVVMQTLSPPVRSGA